MTGKTVLLAIIICTFGLGIGWFAGWVTKKFKK